MDSLLVWVMIKFNLLEEGARNRLYSDGGGGHPRTSLGNDNGTAKGFNTHYRADLGKYTRRIAVSIITNFMWLLYMSGG